MGWLGLARQQFGPHTTLYLSPLHGLSLTPAISIHLSTQPWEDSVHSLGTQEYGDKEDGYSEGSQNCAPSLARGRAPRRVTRRMPAHTPPDPSLDKSLRFPQPLHFRGGPAHTLPWPVFPQWQMHVCLTLLSPGVSTATGTQDAFANVY